MSKTYCIRSIEKMRATKQYCCKCLLRNHILCEMLLYTITIASLYTLLRQWPGMNHRKPLINISVSKDESRRAVFVTQCAICGTLIRAWELTFISLNSFQFKLPDDIVEQLKIASREEENIEAIEKYAQNLPILTRAYIGGSTFSSCIFCPTKWISGYRNNSFICA